MREQRKMRGVFERPAGSGVFWINYYDADGRRHREKIGREKVAIDAFLQRRTEIREGKFHVPRAGSQLTFQQLTDLALAQKKVRLAPLSYQADCYRAARLVELLGDLPLRSVTSQRLEELVLKFREDGVSGPTTNRYRSLLSSIFSFAVRTGRLQANPMARVQRFKENEARVRFLDSDEEKALRKALRNNCPHREPEIDLALHTGIRRGEQFGLRWEQVDLERRILTVTGKTGRRFIPINATAEGALQKLYRRSKGSSFVCTGAKRDGQRDWRRWFEECVKEAGIENFTWHDLRHTFASRLVMAGVDIRSVQELLGHKSILMTMRYAHLSPGHQQANVEKLDGHPVGTRPESVRRSISQLA